MASKSRIGFCILVMSAAVGAALVPSCGLCQNSDRVQQTERPSDASSQRGGDPGSSRENVITLLDGAFKSYGGEAAWEKQKTCRLTYRVQRGGVNKGADAADSVIIEDSYVAPDRLRRLMRSSDNQDLSVFVVNGRFMWTLKRGEAEAKTREVDPEVARPAIIAALACLRHLRNMDGVSVARAEKDGETMVIPVEVRVRQGVTDSSYFDQSSYLIRKCVKRSLGNMVEPTIKDVSEHVTTTRYDEHKSFDGVVLPTRITVEQDGVKVFETKLLHVEFPGTLDSKLFTRPTVVSDVRKEEQGGGRAQE